MARMYSKKQGKSGSKKPMPVKQSWVRYKAKEIELLIAKIAKDGKSASQIGIILRDRYGIPSVRTLTSKSIGAILREKKAAPSIPEDLMALIRKNIMIRKHLDDNKQDKTAKRGLELTESKIRRLIKYYKSNKMLSADWKYDPAKIKLLVE